MHDILQNKFWIFDMDGTLTIPQHNFDEICKRLQIPSDSQILDYIDSLPINEKQEAEKILKDWEREVAESTIVAEDAAKLLEVLRERDAKFAILTRNVEELTYITLEKAGLLQYFSPPFIIARDTCEPKPSPLGIFTICSLWDIQPQDAVMVGDYIYDIQAGFEAGSKTILVHRGKDTGFTEQTDFLPTLNIASFWELL